MSIIELQRDLEYFPDQGLTQLLEQGGDDRYPGYLAGAEVERRIGLRKRYEMAQKPPGPEDIATQRIAELQGGIGGIPGEQNEMNVPGMDQGIPSADMSQMAQGPMPQQAQMMASGGLVPGYQEGGDPTAYGSWREEFGARSSAVEERQRQAAEQLFREGLGPDDRRYQAIMRNIEQSGSNWEPEPKPQRFNPFAPVPQDITSVFGPVVSTRPWSVEGLEGFTPEEIHIPTDISENQWEDWKEITDQVHEDESGQAFRYYTQRGVDISDPYKFVESFYEPASYHWFMGPRLGGTREIHDRWGSPEATAAIEDLERMGSDIFQTGAINAVTEDDVVESEDSDGPPTESDTPVPTPNIDSPVPPPGPDSTDRILDSVEDDGIIRVDPTRDPLPQAHDAITRWQRSLEDRAKLNKLRRETGRRQLTQAETEAAHRSRQMDTLMEMMQPTDSRGLDLVRLGKIMSSPSREIIPLTEEYISSKQDRIKQDRRDYEAKIKEIWRMGAQNRQELNDAKNAMDNMEVTIENERITRGEDAARWALTQHINAWVLEAREAGLDERLTTELASALRIAREEIEGRIAVGEITGPTGLSGSIFNPAYRETLIDSFRLQFELHDEGSSEWNEVNRIYQNYNRMFEQMMELGGVSYAQGLGELGSEEEVEEFLGLTPDN